MRRVPDLLTLSRGGIAAALIGLGFISGEKIKAQLKLSLQAGSLVVLVALIFLAPGWNPKIINSGPYVYYKDYISAFKNVQELKRHLEARFKTLFYKEGVEATVSVFQTPDKILALRINGKTDASTGDDIITQIFSAHLPLLLHPHPKKVMILGLASGMTMGSVLTHPVEEVDCVEISPEVVEASQYFNDYNNHKVAYFSLEYGLDTSLPVYSGGLGILSGDTLKSASDMGIPMVAVGLLYRYGYFRQFLSTDGWQQERYEENDWYHMPVTLEKNADGNPIKFSVDFGGTPVYVQIWKVMVGITPLYLLDTNIPENPSKYREITSVLYSGDKDTRLKQEILLGIGGVRALEALGIKPDIFHLNEGHSMFLLVERIKNLMEKKAIEIPKTGILIAKWT